MLRSTLRPVRQLVRLQSLRYASTVTAAPTSTATPAIENLESRWESLSTADQTAVIEHLQTRQLGPWSELSAAEKKALWYVSYGAWGPRKPIHPEGESRKIALSVAGVLVLAGGIFAISRALSEGLGPTMTKEWQEKSDEILKANNSNPFRGYSQVQSASKKN